MRIIVLIIFGAVLAYLFYFFLSGGKTLSPRTFPQEFEQSYNDFVRSLTSNRK